ncbi:MAG: YgjV family protein [Candidatus Woesearchaeota archaeon]|nr:MAG: YgjV family protein [Candidatus Woesearchaeota archaeon]
MINIYDLFGIIGVIFIVVGILLRNRKEEHIMFILGGLLLGIYSIYLKSYIFMILQIIVVLSAVYELVRFDLKK